MQIASSFDPPPPPPMNSGKYKETTLQQTCHMIAGKINFFFKHCLQCLHCAFMK